MLVFEEIKTVSRFSLLTIILDVAWQLIYCSRNACFVDLPIIFVGSTLKVFVVVGQRKNRFGFLNKMATIGNADVSLVTESSALIYTWRVTEL